MTHTFIWGSSSCPMSNSTKIVQKLFEQRKNVRTIVCFKNCSINRLTDLQPKSSLSYIIFLSLCIFDKSNDFFIEEKCTQNVNVA